MDRVLLLFKACDVVVYLCRNAHEKRVPEAFGVQHLSGVTLNGRQLHSIIRLVDFLPIDLEEQHKKLHSYPRLTFLPSRLTSVTAIKPHSLVICSN